eukprot:CAMPEP_0184371228 /NCGR_PEP_ID=MMETSP1089-20130417/163280_1 /TAXON_ID=38269 ORGANISM="Gloeochaete wittrockiana, Strain SAG46.84" /NCGR_SAMPLE_ID=MMETSP1089 /ASSEMBLY_ACC=CAM_ASM_000445 /LENGTH=328 /DNA_ID=CAMNT_0026713953 /DNA_START=408 /DNA_END=1389 /DNA_ORIENTATION=+
MMYKALGIFGPEVSQEALYIENVRSIASAVYAGQTATIILYGQTGSGKSYTCEGSLDEDDEEEDKRGIVCRALDELLSFSEQKPSGSDSLDGSSSAFLTEEDPAVSVSVSFAEISGTEVVTDLLRPGSSHLRVGTAPTRIGGPSVVGLSVVPISSPIDYYELLSRARIVRALANTDREDHASRSHTVLSIHVKRSRGAKVDESYDSVSDGEGSGTQTSVLNIVDLAGSEKGRELVDASLHEIDGRPPSPSSPGEGQKIARSFLALSAVLSRVFQPVPQPSMHVPYRDSKLTLMLMNSLTVDSLLLFVATISSSADNITDTLHTLNFSS